MPWSADWRPARHEPHRIYCTGAASVPVQVNLEVQVWPGTVTRRPDDPDDLSGPNRLSDHHRRPSRHVAVPGAHTARMLDVDEPATPLDQRRAVLVATVLGRSHVATRHDDRTGRRSTNWCTTGRAEVSTVMSGPIGGAKPGHHRRPQRCDALACHYRACPRRTAGCRSAHDRWTIAQTLLKIDRHCSFSAVNYSGHDGECVGFVFGVCVGEGAALYRLRGDGQREVLPMRHLK